MSDILYPQICSLPFENSEPSQMAALQIKRFLSNQNLSMQSKNLQPTGWFSLVTSTGQTAGYFTSIDELACAQVPYFMSRDSICAIPAPSTANSGLMIGGTEGGQLIVENPATSVSRSNKTATATLTANQSSSTKKVFLPAGTAFRLLGLYEDVSNLVNNKKNRLGAEHAEETLRKQLLIGEKLGQRYLKCLAMADDQILANQMVFIPTTQTGRWVSLFDHFVQR